MELFRAPFPKALLDWQYVTLPHLDFLPSQTLSLQPVGCFLSELVHHRQNPFFLRYTLHKRHNYSAQPCRRSSRRRNNKNKKLPMEDTIITFCCKSGITYPKANPSISYLTIFSSPTSRRKLKTHFRALSSNTSISLPSPPPQFSKPSKTPKLPSSIISPDPHSSNEFGEMMLYLESIGIDFFSLMDDYPSIISSLLLEDIKSTVHYMRSLGFTSSDFRRICGMCPEILTNKISDISPVFTFLLREANVKGSDLRRVIHRRPRLLVCSVEHRLRPTLYFLQSLGISEVQNYTSLLSCSVEDKFIPRLDYLEKTMGFCYRDAISMVRRFPPLFCYSIKHNFEPKFNYFVMEMGRDIKELKEFPQYFSFSLENRIKPRHLSCVSKGVCLPLPVMLKTHETVFRHKLEVCCSSSPPLTTSPLWWSTPKEVQL